MKNISRDKIITIIGAGILGYYISISILQNLVWSFLIKFLAPINDRNLPEIYTGILGGLFFIIFAYILFSTIVENKKIKLYKVKYSVAIVLLILSPFIIGIIFRIHAVEFVKNAENTVPTRFKITQENKEIMFQTGDSSATGLQKTISVVENDLPQMGEYIQGLTLEKISNSRIDDVQGTIWINYDYNGNWYSKIISFNNLYFQEDISNARVALYQSRELQDALQNLIEKSKDIFIYDNAYIVNSDTIGNKEEQIHIEGKEFKDFISSLNEQNKIEPGKEVAEKLTLNGRNDFISQEDKNIYGIFLYGNNNKSKNFLVYDKKTGVIRFEENYYSVGDIF